MVSERQAARRRAPSSSRKPADGLSLQRPIAEERSNVVGPDLRLLERWEVPAVRRNRQIDHVVAGFGGLARCCRVRADRNISAIVLRGKRAASGGYVDVPVGELWKKVLEKGWQQPSIHVPALVVQPGGRRP